MLACRHQQLRFCSDSLWSDAEPIFNSILGSFYLPTYMANQLQRAAPETKATQRKVAVTFYVIPVKCFLFLKYYFKF